MMNPQVRHLIAGNVPAHRRRIQLPGWGGRLLLLFALIFGIIGLPGCSATKTSDRDLAIVDVDEARRLADQSGGGWRIGRASQVAWVDPRTEAEFQQERLPGAILLPLDRARDDHRPLREYDVLIVYGNDFNSPRAAALSKLLIEMGHRDVRTLRGGLRAWKAAGYSTESGER